MAPEPDHIDRIVAQWKLERPDVDVAALAVWGRLFRVIALADAELGREMRRHGLQSGWFDLLAALRRAGSPFALNPKALMRATMLSSGGITKRLDGMEGAGLVERRPDPVDGRATLVRLTRRGRSIIDRLLPEHVDNERKLLSPLDEAEQRSLDRHLRKLLSRLDMSAA